MVGGGVVCGKIAPGFIGRRWSGKFELVFQRGDRVYEWFIFFCSGCVLNEFYDLNCPDDKM